MVIDVMNIRKKRILTWVKPTGDIHIGNYFGAIKPLIDLANEHIDAEIFSFVPNMHALTTLHDGEAIRRNTYNGIKTALACGVDAERYFIYNQSDVPAHAQLTRVLSCITHMWFMERMHVYKDAVAKWKATDLSVGTFTYPILMAVDILLYDADIVPVGKDQKQHVEYARDIAQKFNHMFGETFVLPEVIVREDVAVIPWIDGRKMSKSYHNVLSFIDDEKTFLKKIKQIPTWTQTVDEPKDPDDCNVYAILTLFLTWSEDDQLRKKYTDWWLSYKYVKELLYEKIIAFMQPIQQRYTWISDQYVQDLLKKNAVYANELAEQKVQEVYNKIWFSL